MGFVCRALWVIGLMLAVLTWFGFDHLFFCAAVTASCCRLSLVVGFIVCCCCLVVSCFGIIVVKVF